MLRQEQREIRELKKKYIIELQERSALEKLIRQCIEDKKIEIIETKNNHGEADPEMEKLIASEKIMTLVYDKTFFHSAKKVDLVLSEKQKEQERIIKAKQAS